MGTILEEINDQTRWLTEKAPGLILFARQWVEDSLCPIDCDREPLYGVGAGRQPALDCGQAGGLPNNLRRIQPSEDTIMPGIIAFVLSLMPCVGLGTALSCAFLRLG